MIATDAAADRLVAGGARDLLANFWIARAAIERERLGLEFGRAEIEPWPFAPAALLLGERQHPAADSAPPHVGIDIHASQLHGVIARSFEAEHAGQRATLLRHPESAAALRIIIGNAVDLL